MTSERPRPRAAFAAPFRNIRDGDRGIARETTSNAGRLAPGRPRPGRGGDGSRVFWTFDPRCVTRVKDYDVAAIAVPREGADAKLMAREFFVTLNDPEVYHSARGGR